MRNPFTPSVFVLGIAVVASFHAVPAQADIYAWRDEQGRLVLSKQPAPPGVAVRTFAVHGNDRLRTTGLRRRRCRSSAACMRPWLTMRHGTR